MYQIDSMKVEAKLSFQHKQAVVALERPELRLSNLYIRTAYPGLFAQNSSVVLVECREDRNFEYQSRFEAVLPREVKSTCFPC